jgi:hypothetical protein
MIKVYHGTSLENYTAILIEGLNNESWVTMEYEDAESYAVDKELNRGAVICFGIPKDLFWDYFVEKDENFEALSNEHYITKKVLPKEFIIDNAEESEII